MEVALVVLAALALGGALYAAAGRLRRADAELRPREELAGLVAGAGPSALARDDVALDLETGALDPDELDVEPLAWDEGADDELG